jgi:AcrR family transcriptional regulator
VTREQIVDAADALALREGLDRLTVRRLSDALAVTPAALYWHVDSKQSLVTAVIDRAYERIELPHAAHGSWLDGIIESYSSARAVLLRYSGISQALLSITPTEVTLAVWHYVYERLLEGGFDDDAAVDLFVALSTFVVGHVVMVDSTRVGQETHVEAHADQLRTILSDRPEFVPFVRSLEGFDDAKSREQFLRGIEMLIRAAAAANGVSVPPRTAGLAEP